MHLRRPNLAAAIAMLLVAPGCVPAATPSGRAQPHQAGVGETATRHRIAATAEGDRRDTVRGRFRYGFEVSTLEGCWLSPGRYRERFEAPPAGSGGVYEYDVVFRGRRTEAVGREMGGSGLGHMGRYPCEYHVEELISAERVVPAERK